MVNKRFWFGILVTVLVFGMTVVGCENIIQDVDGYTFEFKVESYSWSTEGNIIKVEFIDGSNAGENVLETKTFNIAPGEMSSAFTVSGFTQEYDNEDGIFGVKVTYDRGSSFFDWGHAKNNAKIRVYGNSFAGLIFYNGNW